MSDHEEKRMKLFSACEAGDKSLLVKLAKSGVNPSDYDMTNDQGKSSLHIACHYGHIDIVRLLIEVYGCSSKVVDNTGSTPFHDACYYDQVLIVDYLIHTSMKPKECLLSVDFKGNTPFHKANQAGSLRVIKYILYIIVAGLTPPKLGLDFQSKFYSQSATQRPLTRYYTQNLHYFKLTNKVGDVPLAAACRHGHLTLIQMYMHYNFCRLFHNIPDLVNTSSQCGQFQIAHYLQNESKFGHSHRTLSISDDELPKSLYYRNNDDYTSFGHHNQLHGSVSHSIDFHCEIKSKRWSTIAFHSQETNIKCFCMAVLHDNDEYIRAFLTLQEDRFSSTENIDICLAACVADNVIVLSKFVSNEAVSHSNCSLLHVACEWGSKHAAEYLITTGKCDVNAINDVGETPLHIACRHERVEIVTLLLKSNKCNIVNKLSLSNETPLHLVSLHANPAIIDLLLGNECLSNIDTPDIFGDTPLMNACQGGSMTLVKHLVDKGCNPVYVNSLSKEMPVHVACRMKRLDILQILLYNYRGKVDHRNIFGETPLSIALNNYCMDIVTYLIKTGLCDVTLTLCTCKSNSTTDSQCEYIVELPHENAVNLQQKFIVNKIECPTCHFPNPHPMTPGYYCCKYCKSMIKIDHITFNPLSDTKTLNKNLDSAVHFACKRNDLELLQLCLSVSPESATIPNSYGDTPLHIAASNGSVSVMKCVIACCKESLDNVLNNSGNSALHLACIYSFPKVVKLLLDRCSVHLTNKSGNSPIHVASSKKSTALVGCLLENCSGNLDHQRNKKNETYLHIATKAGDLDTIKLLMKYCSTTCQNSDDDTPIHIACASNNQSVVECLLEKTTSTYPFVNKRGETYLHAACNLKAKMDIVKILFDKGYRCLGNVPDKKGDIPLHYACRSGQTELVEYLMSDGRCDPYKFNNDGLSPLYEALQRHNFELILYIHTKRLCDLNQHVRRGSSLLHCLIQTTDDVQSYYSRRSYTRLTLNDHLLCYSSRPDFQDILPDFEILLKNLIDSRIFDLNATDGNGNTVLHLACKFEQHETVRLLLSTDTVGQSLSHRNHYHKTPIQLTRDYSIIRLLIRYGANPEDVYDRFATVLERSKEEQPLEPAVKVIVLGNSTAGKTTLVKVLKSRGEDVMQVKGSTAGIETSEYNSDKFGRVTFHDFAGQPEYESSHSAFLERCSSSVQPPLFLLLVNANQCKYIEKRIHNWLSFIQNHCTCNTSTPPHVIVIGSHIDEVDDSEKSQTTDMFVKAIGNFKSSDFECFEPVFLDCRKVCSVGMKALLSKLEKSCLSLKKFVELDCRCHILFANLLKWFPTDSVIKVEDLRLYIRQGISMEIESEYQSEHQSKQIRMLARHRPGYIRTIFDYYDTEDSSGFLLPISKDPLLKLLKSLHIGGHILLLEGDTLENSWIVMNQDALFKSVNGTLFAPKEFEEHFELENNTGVVPLTKLQNLFPNLDFRMVKQFLIHYEFCNKIKDDETLKLIHGNNELKHDVGSSYYFFPGFVQSEKPAKIWDTPEESPYGFSCGWILQCLSRHFFETRFLHVLLLRLTFTFVTSSPQASVLKRECNIWKNGLHWGTRNGVEVLVEIIEEKTVLLVLVRCFPGMELEAVKVRTAVLKKIWEAKMEFCPKVNTDEYLIHPSGLKDASLQDLQMHQISISEIAQTVTKGYPCVLCSSNNKPLPLDMLLYYEPYSRMGEDHVKLLFSKENALQDIPADTLYDLSTSLHPVYQHLIKVLEIPERELGFHRDQWKDHPVQLLYHLFESWQSRRENPTFKTLRSEFDQYSIFFGRDPQVMI